jgi:hypothetical protein
MEMGLVAHCGDMNRGSYVHSLALTDIASGWTECAPPVVRESTLLVEALDRIRIGLPFPLRALDADNGGEFLNETMIQYCFAMALSSEERRCRAQAAAAMLAHYGTLADVCRVRDPNRKGTVESAIQHTQSTALKGRRYESAEAQNTWLAHWEERWAAPRIHGRKKARSAGAGDVPRGEAALAAAAARGLPLLPSGAPHRR